MLINMSEIQHLLFKLIHFRVTVYVQLAVLRKCFADVPVGGDTVEQQPNVELYVI